MYLTLGKRLNWSRVQRLRARLVHYYPRWVWYGVALVIALVALSTSGRALAAPSSTLRERARELRIAQSLPWLRLLHYRRSSSGKPVSQVDSKAFFLAPHGERDPEAELEATLNAFLRPMTAGREDEHALCRFPARRRLLDEWLHFEGALHIPSCPALARHLSDLDPESVSVVYAANFLNNPASAFGHTFLRLKKRRAPGVTLNSEGLDHSVEYTANTDTNNPFLYAFKGLTGLFPGVFRFHSFESKIHEYGDAEARDLWQYDLDLSTAEVTALALHLWELSVAHMDYYYLTKNCSYHVLATIEAVAPRIDLVDHLNFVVLPRDTIKALFSVRGLVTNIEYHPSLRSQFRAQAARLGSKQKDTVEKLTHEPDAALPENFSLADGIAVLDTAVLVLDARFARSPESPADAAVEAARARLIARRTRLSTTIPALPPITPPYDKAPERANGSMRLSLGTGITSQYGSSFSSLGYRLALHDLTDPADGEPELSQLQFLDLRLRYDYGERALTVDRLTFAELVALNPLTRYEHALSWRGRAFGMRLHDRACRDCFAHGLDLGIGATVATENEHLAFFLMADAYVAFSSSLDGIGGSFVRVGIGPFAGLRARLPANSIALLTANWSYLPGQTLHSTYDLRVTLRSALARDVAVGLEAAVQPSSSECLLGSYLYF